MNKRPRQHGFSLLETLLAVSTLAVGMVFVAGTFMAGIYFTSLSTERTIAAVASDEALAKIRLYGLDLNDPNLKTDSFVSYDELATIPADEFLYPSLTDSTTRQYSWMALCKRMGAGSRLVQVTVFVCRHAGTDARYWARGPGADPTEDLEQGPLPRPLRIAIAQDSGLADDEVSILDTVASDEVDENTFASEGTMLVDDKTGQIYRVLQRYVEPPDRIKLDRPWSGADIGSAAGGRVWVVPRPVAGGRSPLVAVYQEVLRF
jgi:hypothetical protein